MNKKIVESGAIALMALFMMIFAEPMNNDTHDKNVELTNKVAAATISPIPAVDWDSVDISKANVVAVAEEEPEVVIPELDEADIDILARLITAEVGYSQNYSASTYEDACYCTGSVVLNRMANPKYPDTLRGVIFQSGQYAVVNNGTINRQYDDIAWEIAEDLLAYGSTIDSRVIFQANFVQGSGIYKQIGGLYFCYE